MARHSRYSRTRTRTRNHRATSDFRTQPWVLLAEATEIVRERPFALAPQDRDRLGELVRLAGGRGINLSPRERSEAARLIDRASGPAKRPVPVPLIAARRRGR